jgi:hypothetical protein
MNDLFEKKVRAAAVAGWWVVLIAIGFLTLLWLIYLAVMSTHPALLLSLWGPGTVSLAFPAGKDKCVAVKVIDPRGNEVMQVHTLKEEDHEF